MREKILIVGELAAKNVIFGENLPHFAKPSSGSWIPGSHVLWTLAGPSSAQAGIGLFCRFGYSRFDLLVLVVLN